MLAAITTCSCLYMYLNLEPSLPFMINRINVTIVFVGLSSDLT